MTDPNAMLELADAIAQRHGDDHNGNRAYLLTREQRDHVVAALRAASAPAVADVRPDTQHVKDIAKRVRGAGDREAADLIEVLFLSTLPRQEGAKSAAVADEELRRFSRDLWGAIERGNVNSPRAIYDWLARANVHPQPPEVKP